MSSALLCSESNCYSNKHPDPLKQINPMPAMDREARTLEKMERSSTGLEGDLGSPPRPPPCVATRYLE